MLGEINIHIYIIHSCTKSLDESKRFAFFVSADLLNTWLVALSFLDVSHWASDRLMHQLSPSAFTLFKREKRPISLLKILKVIVKAKGSKYYYLLSRMDLQKQIKTHHVPKVNIPGSDKRRYLWGLKEKCFAFGIRP